MKPHEIERHQALPHQAEIVLQLDPSLFWFSGHFSVQPLLPGVAQLNWAMDYATTWLAFSQYSKREVPVAVIARGHRHPESELAGSASDALF